MPAVRKSKTKKAGNIQKNSGKSNVKRTGFETEIFFLLAFGILILLILSNFGLAGIVGVGIKWLEFGLIGVMGYVIPFLTAVNLIYLAVNRPVPREIKSKFIAAYISLVLLSALIQRIYNIPGMEYSDPGGIFLYSARNGSGGGILGALICYALYPVGETASVIIIIILLIICMMVIFNWSVFKTFKYIFGDLKVRKTKKSTEDLNTSEYFSKDTEKEYDEKKINSDNQAACNVNKTICNENNGLSDDRVNDKEIRKVVDDMADMREAYSKNRNPERNPKKNLRMNNKSTGRSFSVFSIKEAVRENTDKGSDVETIELTNMYPENSDEHREVFPENTFGDVIADGDDFIEKYPVKTHIPDSNIVVSDSLETVRDEVTDAKKDHNDIFGGLSEIESGAESQKNSTDDNVKNVGIQAARNISSGNGVYTADNKGENAVDSQHDGNLLNVNSDVVPREGAIGNTGHGGINSHKDAVDIIGGGNVNTEESTSEYVFPPVSLLNKPKIYDSGNINAENQEMADNLRKILEIFGVKVKITGISIGPTVTRFEMQPEIGTKVSKVVNLKDEIKMGLAVSDIRIQAPIPGKSAIGIEIPNKKPRSVSFRELIESNRFKESKSKVSFAVGEDIGGKVVVGDIADMPHIIIAGSTGSGKSVCINALIMSVLYKASPDDVKMIMVDPKVVELSIYNGIPHLLIPVVSDPKKAASALNWAVAEMDKRYNKLAELGSRNIKEYNNKIISGEYGENHIKMPQILVIIDELADLMMVAKNEVEAAIVRLAQKARAAGIHLIIATQRPSADVITGLIKANIPSKIAFAVSNGSNSRIILDENGAENLLGKGDMLYAPRNEKPKRVQGAFVSDDEVSRVVEFLKEHSGNVQMNEDISKDMENEVFSVSVPIPGADDEDSLDSLFEDAGRFVIEKEKASIGMLQRNFRIGFNRAGRIIDQLSEAGVVGPDIGTKPRKVLITMQEFEELLSKFR